MKGDPDGSAVTLCQILAEDSLRQPAFEPVTVVGSAAVPVGLIVALLAVWAILAVLGPCDQRFHLALRRGIDALRGDRDLRMAASSGVTGAEIQHIAVGQ
jgi:hypothetical protein